MRAPALALFCAIFTLISSADAATTQTPATLSAEDYLAQMQVRSDHTQVMVEGWEAAEVRGDAVPGLEEQSAALTPDVEGMIHDATMAHQAGHAVGSFWLAQFAKKSIVETPEEKQQACAFYQVASDRGLLAAAVIHFYGCNEAFRRFAFDDPELLKGVADVKRLLKQREVFQKYYPLPTRQHMCIEDSPAPDPTGMQAKLRKGLGSKILGYDQYRAEAYYILAIADVSADGDIGPKNVSYIDQAIALGCSDFLKVKQTYEQQLSKQSANH